MLRTLIYSLLLQAVVSVVSVGAQDSLVSALDPFPECAQTCLIEAFTAGLCLPTDNNCICSDETFQSNVTDCVQAFCNIPEALVTQNASLTACGVPVRDRSKTLTVQSLVMFGSAVAFVLMRITYKIALKLEFGMDDWFLIATATAMVPQVALLLAGSIPNGIGKDIWTVSAEQITSFLRFWYAAAIIYFFQTTAIKLAFIAFYMRIFTTQSTKRLLWGTFVFVTLWGTAFIVLAILVCTPISYLWTQWDGLHEGRCIDDAAYVWTNAAMNIALDFWILAIPLWELRKLQLHWKKKIGVVLMFCLGAFVTVMSILRLKSLVLYQRRDNVTWEFAQVHLWSSIEIGVGIICACLPTLRLLLVRIWPVLSGSMNTRSDQWYQSGKGSDGWTSTSSRGLSSPQQGFPPRTPGGFSQVVSINGRSAAPIPPAQHPGIGMDKSFTVQFSDEEGSDISLVMLPPTKSK